jgi:membrane protein
LFAERYLGLWLSGEQISQSSIFSYILFSFNFLFFIIVYYFVPNTEVRPTAAVFSGIFSGSLFILSKNIYGIYTANIITYNQLYGPLSIIPIFLLWLYLIWIIILLGAVVSYVFHYRSDLKYLPNQKKINQSLKNLIPTAILLTLYKNYKDDSSGPLSFSELLAKINLPAEDIEIEIENLKAENIIAETENGKYLPLNKATKISIWDSYQNDFLDKKFEIENIFREPEMQKLYREIKKEEKSSFKKLKFVDFLN